jgi:hypothetical protein
MSLQRGASMGHRTMSALVMSWERTDGVPEVSADRRTDRGASKLSISAVRSSGSRRCSSCPGSPLHRALHEAPRRRRLLQRQPRGLGQRERYDRSLMM